MLRVIENLSRVIMIFFPFFSELLTFKKATNQQLCLPQQARVLRMGSYLEQIMSTRLNPYEEAIFCNNLVKRSQSRGPLGEFAMLVISKCY